MCEKGLGCWRLSLNFAKVFRTAIEKSSWSATRLVKELETNMFGISLFFSLQEK